MAGHLGRTSDEDGGALASGVGPRGVDVLSSQGDTAVIQGQTNSMTVTRLQAFWMLFSFHSFLWLVSSLEEEGEQDGDDGNEDGPHD